MAIATKMASPAAISTANMVNLSRGKDVRFNTSTMPLRGFSGRSWNFPINPGVDSANMAEFQKHALEVVIPVFDAVEDNNVQQVVKSNCPRMLMKERNPKRLINSASKRIEL